MAEKTIRRNKGTRHYEMIDAIANTSDFHRLGAPAARMLVWLLRRMNTRTRRAWPSLNELGRVVFRDEGAHSRVARARQEIIDAGFLYVEREGGGWPPHPKYGRATVLRFRRGRKEIEEAARIVSALRTIIANEDKTTPLSDDALATALKERGIELCLPMATYRRQFGIPGRRDRARPVEGGGTGRASYRVGGAPRRGSQSTTRAPSQSTTRAPEVESKKTKTKKLPKPPARRGSADAERARRFAEREAKIIRRWKGLGVKSAEVVKSAINRLDSFQEVEDLARWYERELGEGRAKGVGLALWALRDATREELRDRLESLAAADERVPAPLAEPVEEDDHDEADESDPAEDAALLAELRAVGDDDTAKVVWMEKHCGRFLLSLPERWFVGFPSGLGAPDETMYLLDSFNAVLRFLERDEAEREKATRRKGRYAAKA